MFPVASPAHQDPLASGKQGYPECSVVVGTDMVAALTKGAPMDPVLGQSLMCYRARAAHLKDTDGSRGWWGSDQSDDRSSYFELGETSDVYTANRAPGSPVGDVQDASTSAEESARGTRIVDGFKSPGSVTSPRARPKLGGGTQ
jgi:hypothetical protein